MGPALKHGLVAAAGMIAWVLAEYALGLHGPRIEFGRYTDWGTEVILVVALWRLLHHQLHAANRYWLPVWEGVLQGMQASFVAAMGFYIFLSLYLYYLNPEFPDLHLIAEVARLRADGVPEEDIQQMVRGFRWSMGPVGLPLTVGGFYLFIGLVASPLLTLWLNWRRKEPVHAG
jgi:hypothetical protein